MLNSETKRHIDAARDVLVGVAPNPTTQIDQITYALIYKFMDDMDQAAIKAGGEPTFFTGELEPYAWSKLVDSRMGNQEKMNLYGEALTKFSEAKQLPELFRTIFKAAFLPYRSPETLGLFLKEISYFDYTHPEELGNAYEYLLSIMSSQGDAGQFRTPRDIIDFIVEVINPTKDDKILDPACGTAGFLVSTYNHILEQHDGNNDPRKAEKPLTPDERKKLMQNLQGYDIDPTMVRIAQVNMYLHQFKNPQIFQYDSLTSEDRWADRFDVILANPPFMTPKGGIKPHNKFSISANKSEVLFVDYIISHLKPNGRAGIVVPEGIIFQTGNAYKELRKKLIESGLYAVVSLPSGVFQPYSGVKTSILFINNSYSNFKQDILFLDIKNVGTSLGASKKVISENDLPNAKEAISKFENGEVLASQDATLVVAKQVIKDSGMNLTLSNYKPKGSKNGKYQLLQLSEICNIEKGKSSSTKTESGDFPLILTAKESKTSSSYDFEGEGAAVPLISSKGHGKADISRIHYVSGKFALANLLAFVSPTNPEVLSPKYLHLILESSKKDLAKLMKGAANVSMTVKDLSQFQIPVPELKFQSEIVSELESYSAIIAGAQSIIDNWRPIIAVDPAWPVLKLKDVAEWSSGGTPKAGTPDFYNGDIPWAVIGDLNEDVVRETKDRITEKGLQESSAKVQPLGTVMLAMYGASIGKTGIMGVPMATNQAIACAQVRKEVMSELFLLYYLQSQKRDFVGAGAGGAQPNISQAIVKEWEIPVPSLDIQQEILDTIAQEKLQVDSARKLIETYQNRSFETIEKLWRDGNSQR